jgi:hypothetical protein
MFVRTAVLVTIGALTLLPATAAVAQERVRVERDAPMKRRIEMVTTRKARLGVVVALAASASDSVGATIQSVTPRGPAAKAGIQSGDIITRLDGQSVLGGDTKAEEDQSLPGLRLVELAAKLEPDDTISVEYRRGSDRRTATLVTGNEPMPMGWSFSMSDPDNRVWTMPMPEIDRFRMPEGARLRSERLPEGGFLFSYGGPLSNVELAPLNADLAGVRFTGLFHGNFHRGTNTSHPVRSSPCHWSGGHNLGLYIGDFSKSIAGQRSGFRLFRALGPGCRYYIADALCTECILRWAHLCLFRRNYGIAIVICSIYYA